MAPIPGGVANATIVSSQPESFRFMGPKVMRMKRIEMMDWIADLDRGLDRGMGSRNGIADGMDGRGWPRNIHHCERFNK